MAHDYNEMENRGPWIGKSVEDIAGTRHRITKHYKEIDFGEGNQTWYFSVACKEYNNYQIGNWPPRITDEPVTCLGCINAR